MAPGLARFFHFAVGRGAAEAVKGWHAESPLLHPIAGEFSALGLTEDLADRILVDDTRTTGSNGELGGATTTVADVLLDSHLVHDVDHAAEGADGFGVGEARGITVFDHDAEARPHELDGTAVENLFFEIVPLGFVLEGHLDDACSCTSHSLGNGEGDGQCIAGGVMVDSHASVDAFACEVLLADEVARCVRNKEYCVDVLGRLNDAVEDVESVAEAECFSGGEVGGDVGLVDRWLGRVG